MRLYLDTHIYDHLTNPDHAYADFLAPLLKAVLTDRVQVFGSCEHLEEFAAVRSRDAKRFTAVMHSFQDLVRYRLLRGRHQILQLELNKGQPLSETEARMPASERINLLQGWHRLGGLERHVKDHKTDYADEMNQTGADVVARIEERMNLPEARKAVRDNLPVTIDDVSAFQAGGHTMNPQLPAQTALVTYLLAQAKRQLANQKRVRPSNSHDHSHYVYAAVTKATLITDDREFTRTAALDQTGVVTVRPGTSLAEILRKRRDSHVAVPD